MSSSLYPYSQPRSGIDRRAQFARSRSTAKKEAVRSSRRNLQFPVYKSFIARGSVPEVKYFDTDLSFLFDSTGEVPATGQLALIPQGDTGSTRDGRQATIKSVQIRGSALFTPGASASATCIAYLYLVLDKQANGAPAGITDVFTTAVMDSNLLNLNNSDRFAILRKWVLPYVAQAGATTAYNPSIKSIEFYKKCSIPMNFSGTTGAITEIRSNNLFLMAGLVNQDDTVSFNGVCRLRFQG